MRVAEIAALRVRDVAGGAITVRKGKTIAAARTVPIHPDIAAILAGRAKGKPADAHVFDELPTQRSAARSRASPVSQAFTRARRALGVDERIEGMRQSAVDFHSFRRWFIRKAVDALECGATGFTPWTIADVVGHSTEDMPLAMTMGRYPGRATLRARRRCVEAVRLPK
jgi:integrase